MKAILVNPDRSLTWSEVPEPVCGEGEVIIDIHATACHRADVLQRAGKYPPPPGWPEWMGLECAGVIAESKSPAYKVGDRVCALLGGGGYAEKIAVNAGMCMPIPEGLDFVTAAAIPETFATAYMDLVMIAGMKAGDVVYVAAGASGLGSSAIQIAKLYGCKVITTVSTAEKPEAQKLVPADIFVNYQTEKLADTFDACPPDIALDCAAGSAFGENFARMNVGGRWIIISTLAGEETNLNLRTVMKKNLHLMGVTLRSRTPEKKYEILANLRRDLWGAFEAKTMAPIIYAVLPITEAEKAHAMMDEKHIGKIVMTVK